MIRKSENLKEYKPSEQISIILTSLLKKKNLIINLLKILEI